MVLSGGVDVVVGVVDRFGEVHRFAGANAVIECFGVEFVAEVIECSHGAEDHVGVEVGVVGGGAVDGGGDLWLFDSVEEYGQAYERPSQLGFVAGLVERR